MKFIIFDGSWCVSITVCYGNYSDVGADFVVVFCFEVVSLIIGMVRGVSLYQGI